jgi:hypothetical protein
VGQVRGGRRRLWAHQWGAAPVAWGSQGVLRAKQHGPVTSLPAAGRLRPLHSGPTTAAALGCRARPLLAWLPPAHLHDICPGRLLANAEYHLRLLHGHRRGPRRRLDRLLRDAGLLRVCGAWAGPSGSPGRRVSCARRHAPCACVISPMQRQLLRCLHRAPCANKRRGPSTAAPQHAERRHRSLRPLAGEAARRLAEPPRAAALLLAPSTS